MHNPKFTILAIFKVYGPVALRTLALLYSHHQHLPPGRYTQYLLNSSFSASPPPAPGNLQSASSFCGFTYSGHSYEGNQTVCDFLCLASLTQHNASEVHPCVACINTYFPL